MGDFELNALKREARADESSLEGLLDSLNRACRGSSDTDNDEESTFSGEEVMKLESSITSRLGAFNEKLDKMGDMADRGQLSSTDSIVLQRFRDVSREFSSEFHKLRVSGGACTAPHA